MIHHVGVVTHPIELGFGSQLLNIFGTLGKRPVLLGSKYIKEFDCYCYMYRVGDGSLLELVSPKGGKLLDWYNEHGQHSLHHIAIAVDDIVKETARLRELGVPILTENPVVGVNDILVNFIHPSHCGVMIELVQETSNA